MTKDKQRELLRNFMDQVRDHLLESSDRWPEDWDGHELRQLCIEELAEEITPPMRDKRSRRYRDFYNVRIVENL